MKILIVEDEAELAKSISEYLSENYLCENASTFTEAMHKTELFDYDCMLLEENSSAARMWSSKMSFRLICWALL